MQVSIITVAWNSAATITDTLRSVLNQTYKDIDYWIIDGQSTDGTIEIVRQWQPRFNGRLHLISEKDAGLYDAINKGIRYCAGDIVGILNSDDFFTSDMVIQMVVDNFTERVDAVYGDVHFVKNDNLLKSIRYYSGQSFRRWMLRFGFMPPHPAFYVRRMVYETCGNYDASYKISADFEFMVRSVFVHRITTKYIPLDCVTMRVGGASTRSLRSHLVGTEEDLLACKQNQIKTCRLFVYSKYFLKLYSAFQQNNRV